MVLVLTASVNADTTKVNESEVMDRLSKISSVPDDLDGRVKIASALGDASASLEDNWNPDLVREVGRVFNIVMKVLPNFSSTTELFYWAIIGERKNDFMGLIIQTLDADNQALFIEHVVIIESTDSVGNG